MCNLGVKSGFGFRKLVSKLISDRYNLTNDAFNLFTIRQGFGEVVTLPNIWGRGGSIPRLDLALVVKVNQNLFSIIQYWIIDAKLKKSSNLSQGRKNLWSIAKTINCLNQRF